MIWGGQLEWQSALDKTLGVTVAPSHEAPARSLVRACEACARTRQMPGYDARSHLAANVPAGGQDRCEVCSKVAWCMRCVQREVL